MARKDFGAKPYTYPQPVFILATYNEDGTANAMNAAWGGISEGNEISFCISAGHKTTKNFQRTGAFTVSMWQPVIMWESNLQTMWQENWTKQVLP